MYRLLLGVLLLGIGLPRLVAQESPPLEDRISVLRTITISPSETARDAVCLLCSVVVRGAVNRDAVSVWGSVEVEGHVGADAVAVGGGVRIDSGGSVGADVVAIGGPVEAPPGLLAEEPTSLPWLHFAGQRQVFFVGATVFLLAHPLIALGVGLLLGERRLLHLLAVWRWSPARTLLLGLLALTLVIAGIAVVGMIAEETGSTVTAGVTAAVGVGVLLAAFALGLPVLGLGLGRRLRPGMAWRPAVLVGALAIGLASLLPLLGLVVSLVVWCAVCGLALRAFTLRKAATNRQGAQPSSEVLRYYDLGLEQGRLDEDYFPLERARTRELILRHLPTAPGVVLDVGGAAGAYSFWLAEQGYEVHLVDPSALHVGQAEEASRGRETGRLASATTGDARSLDFADGSASAVLLLGPLYHLTERAERQTALAEARRVLRPGGWLFAAAISRYASLLDGLRGSVFDDEAFARIVEADLTDGQHRNETGKPHYFTTAFFHHPDELSVEMREAGFTLEGLYAVEGPGAFIPGFAGRWGDPRSRERLLDLLRRVESEPALLGASPHLLAVGHKA